MKTAFEISKLSSVDDGRIAAAVDLAIEQCSRDCVDRPGDSGTRKVTLEIGIKPEQGEDGSCETAAVEFQIKTSLPARRSKTFQMATKPSGMLEFNPASPDAIGQRTLDEAGENGGDA